MERTLILVKPDGVQRALTGEIVRRFEARGLKLVGLKLMLTPRALAETHYAEHQGRPFYNGLVEYILSGPLLAIVLEGKNAIAAARQTIGSTKPWEAAPGTIRADLGLDVGRNLVHGSANADDAAREIALWFRPEELVDYGRATDGWITE